MIQRARLKTLLSKAPQALCSRRVLQLRLIIYRPIWTKPTHLVTLLESKHKEGTSSDKRQFLKLSLQDQIRAVVKDHTPSELKMVYAITCAALGVRASVDFFKNGSKDKERFYDFICENRQMLDDLQDRYVSTYADTCVVDENLYD